MGHNGCLMFCQVTADEERHVSPHCRGATSKSGFPTIQASFCAQHPSNVLELPGKTFCLPSDHVVQIHDGHGLSNQKTQPTSPWSLTNSSMLFLVEHLAHTILPVCLVKQLKCLCKIFPKFAAKFHTHALFFKLFHCHFHYSDKQLVQVLSSADGSLLSKPDTRCNQ